MDINPNFKTLVESSINGDASSQKQLFLDYYGNVLLICRRYSKSNFLAEEIANDVFIKIFDHLNKYEFNYPFKSWISRIAINTCIDKIRKDKKKLKVIELVDEIDYEGVEQVTFELYGNQEILPIIQELPPAYRLVFNLYVFEEYKHSEIAELLNISIGTICIGAIGYL